MIPDLFIIYHFIYFLIEYLTGKYYYRTMLTTTDIKKLKEVFATKSDIKNSATKSDLKNFATKDDLKNLDLKMDKKIDILSHDIMDLFKVTNERIDKLATNMNEKFELVLDELKNNKSQLNNHDDRIIRLEDKVFTTTSS